MRKLLFNSIYLVTLLLVTACAGPASIPTVLPTDIEQPAQTPTPVVSQADIEKEKQAVYASFFKNYSGTVIFQEDTSTGFLPSSSNELEQRMAYISSDLPSASKETLNDFLERNRRQPSQLSSDMQLGIRYILLSTEELSAIIDQPNGWDVFHEKYSPSGYMQLSQVGFNETLDEAIVYVGSVPGPMMGSGNYYLMEKKGGQ